MSPHLGTTAKTKSRPNLVSDHLPLHIEIQVKAYLSIEKGIHPKLELQLHKLGHLEHHL